MSTVYNTTNVKFAQGNLDWENDTIVIALLSDSTSYSADIDNEEFVSDVLDGGTTASEFSGTNYSRKTLANTTVAQDNTDDEAELDADDVTWSGLNGDTIQSAIVYKQVGGDDTTPSDDPLYCHLTSSDFPLKANGSDVKLQFNSEGIINIQTV